MSPLREGHLLRRCLSRSRAEAGEESSPAIYCHPRTKATSDLRKASSRPRSGGRRRPGRAATPSRKDPRSPSAAFGPAPTLGPGPGLRQHPELAAPGSLGLASLQSADRCFQERGEAGCHPAGSGHFCPSLSKLTLNHRLIPVL